MREREQVTFTNMCMITGGERVLVLDRVASDWPGITFPGGHVEPGESFADAVIREVREETGLIIEHPALVGVKDWTDENGRYVVLLYRAEQFHGELRSSQEGRVFWVPLADLPGLRLSLDMMDMVRVFTREDLSEFFYRQRSDGSWESMLK